MSTGVVPTQKICIECKQSFNPFMAWHITCKPCHQKKIRQNKKKRYQHIPQVVEEKIEENNTVNKQEKNIQLYKCNVCNLYKSKIAYKSCDDCKILKQKCLKEEFKQDEVYPDLKLHIIYESTIEDHDGYCSDPYDSSQETKTITRYLDVPKFLKKSDFDEDGILSSENWWYFNKSNKPHGNGYCGYKTSYEITSITLVLAKSIPSMLLDLLD
jgi:hypothetical protein